MDFCSGGLSWRFLQMKIGWQDGPLRMSMGFSSAAVVVVGHVLVMPTQMAAWSDFWISRRSWPTGDAPETDKNLIFPEHLW